MDSVGITLVNWLNLGNARLVRMPVLAFEVENVNVHSGGCSTVT